MKILLAGASGLLGRRLIESLLSAGHDLALLTRNPANIRRRIPSNVTVHSWDGRSQGTWTSILSGTDAVVNLSGESIGSGRWTPSRKRALLDSRVQSTRVLVESIARSAQRPAVLVNASAVGYYGNVPEGEVTEEHAPGKDFLAEVCVAWEREAMRAERSGVRVAMPRTGVVLDSEGGALPRLLLPFRLFAGGPLGSGRQWFPWVHIDDEVSAICHAIKTPALSGPFNVTAPQPVRMDEFCKTLGGVLRRPSWARVPGFALKILLGEMAGPLLLSGQRAVPTKLIQSGFAFRHTDLRGALERIVG